MWLQKTSELNLSERDLRAEPWLSCASLRRPRAAQTKCHMLIRLASTHGQVEEKEFCIQRKGTNKHSRLK